MWLPQLFLVQSISSQPSERTVIDLTVQTCKPSEKPDEIVVCRRRDGESPYRIGPPAPEARPIPKAAVKLGGSASLAAEADQGQVGGIPTNRAMLKLKIKF